MSAALAHVDFVPVALPDRRRLATVTRLHKPAVEEVEAPVRLTRRGVAVVAAAVLAVGVAVIWVAWLSAPVAPAAVRPVGNVVVSSGDSLWSIALRVAPGRDPRAEVDTLMRLNHLGNTDLAVGQVLRTR
jgi:hypothetical protein